MKIKNLKISKKLAALTLASSISLVSGCNKQIVDFNKSFNVVIENNNGIISVVGIMNYRDYQGTQVEYVTNDNLRILSSTLQTKLLKVDSYDNLEKFILSLTNIEDKIVYYDQLQNMNIDFSNDYWNKDIIGGHFTYNKAIILTDDYATIIDLDQWKDYDDDDKIQMKLKDGTCILTNADRIKLVNDEYASEDSLEKYAISLVGSIDNVIYYGQKSLTK